jgi:hypothetical protein
MQLMVINKNTVSIKYLIINNNIFILLLILF